MTSRSVNGTDRAHAPVLLPGLARSRMGRSTETLGGGWPTPELRLVEDADGSLYPFLLKVPVETVAVYVGMALMYQRGLTASRSRGVTSCAVLAGALTHLGLSPEVMSTAVTVYRRDTRTWLTAAGTTGAADGLTAGTGDVHLVVWVDSCSRMIDVCIAATPELRAHHPGPAPFPVVVAAANRTSLRGTPPIAQDRGPFIFSWLFAEHTPALAAVLPQDTGRAVDRAGLELAQQVLAQLRFLSGVRDLHSLYRAHPRLADLLAGTTRLPQQARP